MAVLEKNRFPDRFFTFEGGVDSGSAPSAIDDNQVSRSVNTSFPGGYASCRPGFNRRRLTFTSVAAKTAFEDGFFQGAGVYVADDGRAFAVASIGGRLFRTALETFVTEELVIPGTPNNPRKQKAWFCQAETHLVIQDDESRPVLWNGTVVRRATDDEVPVGGPMAYGKGRLWVARGNTYVGGDLVDSTDAGRDTVIKFTENTYIAEGGAFSAPGKIRAMGFLANQDSSTGDGGLMVFTLNVATEFDAPIDRDTWKNLSQPIQRFALLEFGAFSQESLTLVNGDMFFRAPDGIRSLKYAQREFEGWGNTPVSDEVSWMVDFDDDRLLTHASAVNFGNRLLMTCRPQLSARGVWHEGILSLDFKPIAKMTKKALPAWDGVWTGIRTLQVVTARVGGVVRCFAYALDADLRVCLFELTRSDAFDNGKTPIQWAIETRAFVFGNDGMNLFSLDGGDLWFAGVTGKLAVTAEYRTDEVPNWQPWHSWSECVTTGVPSAGLLGSPTPPEFGNPMSLPRRSLPTPAPAVDPNLQRPFRHGYEIQARFTMTGKGSIRRGRVIASAEAEPSIGKLIASPKCPPVITKPLTPIVDEDGAQIINEP